MPRTITASACTILLRDNIIIHSLTRRVEIVSRELATKIRATLIRNSVNSSTLHLVNQSRLEESPTTIADVFPRVIDVVREDLWREREIAVMQYFENIIVSPSHPVNSWPHITTFYHATDNLTDKGLLYCHKAVHGKSKDPIVLSTNGIMSLSNDYPGLNRSVKVRNGPLCGQESGTVVGRAMKQDNDGVRINGRHYENSIGAQPSEIIAYHFEDEDGEQYVIQDEYNHKSWISIDSKDECKLEEWR